MAQFPPIPCDVEPTAHTHIHNVRVLSALEAACPKKYTYKHSRKLSSQTLQTITYNKLVRKQRSATLRRWHRACVFFCFQFWARVHRKCSFSVVFGFCNHRDLSRFVFLTQLTRQLQNKIVSFLKLEDSASLDLISERFNNALESSAPAPRPL